ncbi:MAG: hypothetical protein GY869_06375 [Planctomycetes bacterium]|nr:hypothetical protein [Planctomycetota bacterium]
MSESATTMIEAPDVPVHEDVYQPQLIVSESTMEPTAYEISWQSINAGGVD